MNYAQDDHIFILDAIHNDIFSNGKTTRPSAEILPGTPHVRKSGKEEKTVCDGFSEAARYFHTAAFRCDVIPNVV